MLLKQVVNGLTCDDLGTSMHMILLTMLTGADILIVYLIEPHCIVNQEMLSIARFYDGNV